MRILTWFSCNGGGIDLIRSYRRIEFAKISKLCRICWTTMACKELYHLESISPYYLCCSKYSILGWKNIFSSKSNFAQKTSEERGKFDWRNPFWESLNASKNFTFSTCTTFYKKVCPCFFSVRYHNFNSFRYSLLIFLSKLFWLNDSLLRQSIHPYYWQVVG